MASRQELLQSIHPDMKLTKDFFLSVYADEITYPGSSEEVIQKLEMAGCSNARKYYAQVVEEYQRKRDKELKPVAKFVQAKWDKEWEKLVKEYKGGEELRMREKRIQDLLQKSDRELLNLLRVQSLI
ncbi:MAG: hypothetical protein J6C12_04200 [Lachnospiraceae bacterium]|nr:hypothetical protein [Lachnospiraceae bacterium]